MAADLVAENFFNALKDSATKRTPTVETKGSPVEISMSKEPGDYLTPITLGTLFTHSEAHPIVLDLALTKAFGLEWLDWEPESLWQSIEKHFNTKISEHTRSKIQAVKTVHVSDLVSRSWPVFEKVVQALNGNLAEWGTMQKCSIDQLYAGVDIISSLKNIEYQDEVKLYMAGCVLDDNVFFVPDTLSFIQKEVNQPYFLCLTCGNEDLALFHDGICDTCSMRFDPQQGFSMKPRPDKKNAGKDIEVFLKFDHRPIKEKWDKISGTETDKLEFAENRVDAQVHRLLVARDYMNIRRKQLITQLTALKSWFGAE